MEAFLNFNWVESWNNIILDSNNYRFQITVGDTEQKI